jgi:transposase
VFVFKFLFHSVTADVMDLIIEKINKVAFQLDPPIRRRKAPHSEVTEVILFLLKTGVPWRYTRPRDVSFHTVYKRFRVWEKLGVFEKVWKDLLATYSEKQLQTNANWFKKLFIDSTMIKNVAGRDCLGRNHYDRSRLATKMSVICDTAEVPISCSFYPANINDIKTVNASVKNIACPVKNDGRVVTTLAGDKAYISKAVYRKLRHHNIRMIAPLKRNSLRKKLIKADEDTLKSRSSIEHVFCRLDKFRRIHCRQEQLISSYAALNFIAMAIVIGKKMK